MDLELVKRKGNGKYLFDFQVTEYEGGDHNETESVRSKEQYSIEFEVKGLKEVIYEVLVAKNDKK